MLKNSPFYAGFAVDDLAKAKRFYAETLGGPTLSRSAPACSRSRPGTAKRFSSMPLARAP
jgi:hypothetical protein